MVDLAPPYAPTADDDVAQSSRSWRAAIIDFCRRQPLGTVGLALVLVMAAAGLSAEWIAPYSPTSNDFAVMTEPPSWAHLMGTDQFGRDLFSRIVFGARTALIVGFSCAIVGGGAGLVLGVASAYFGGRVDLLLQRLVDVVMAFPLIIMALAVIAIFGSGVFNVIVAITIPLIPRCARVVRSSALAIREVLYIDAARACGFGHARIILRHMVPIRLDGAVDRGLSRSRHRAHSLRLQPVRRRAPRCPGSQAARSLIGWQSSQMTTPLMAKSKM